MAARKRRELAYYLPEPAKPHTILRIPGSHTLYIGPLSCTRRHIVHAHEYGDVGNVSSLFISEADVISGRYEDLVVDSIAELSKIINPAPHIYFLAVFCIDDFLGTDEEALLDRLCSEYPGNQFVVQHIDPVSLNDKMNMGSKKNAALYSFIMPGQVKDNGINFIGNFVSLEKDNDFLALLDKWGIGPVRELFHCETYDDYQDMGRSCLNILMRRISQGAAELMKKKLDIDYYPLMPGYDAYAVARQYNEVGKMLGKDKVDFSNEIKAAIDDARRTADMLDALPVAVDCSASLMPSYMAKALIEYGFNVRYVFKSSHEFKLDAEAENYIIEECPNVMLTTSDSFMHVKGLDASEGKREKKECLAIGSDCALILNAAYFADIWHDEGYFGFQGIHRLMKVIRDAVFSDGKEVKFCEKEVKFCGKEVKSYEKEVRSYEKEVRSDSKGV